MPVNINRMLRISGALIVVIALCGICLHAVASEAPADANATTVSGQSTAVWLTKDRVDAFMGRLEAEDPNKVIEMQQLYENDPVKFEQQYHRIERNWFRGDIRGMVFGAVGGLGLFLFGMGLMSDGLKKVAGQKLKKLLESLTKHRVVGVLMGAGVTCLIQSSSATTVMTVGFVNAGLLTLKQALCVVLGANIGTTFTAWLVSAFAVFKISSYALPIVGVGFLLSLAGRTQKSRGLGSVMLGFGILFLGIHFMKEAFSPLSEYSDIQNALIWLGGNPILAVLAGTTITMLLQSSSASIAMIQTLAFVGAFGLTDWHQTLQVTIPFILGDNIGTTITAQIAALQTSRNAKRAAMGHTIFNVIGVAYILPFVWLGIYAHVVEWIVWAATSLFKDVSLSQHTIMYYLAVAHSTFNVINTIIFLPLIGVLEAIVMKILPVTQKETARRPVALEEHLLHTPVIALEQAQSEIVRMAKAARKAVESALNGIVNDDPKQLAAARELEDFTDDFQLEITSYLTALSRRQLSDDVSVRLPVLLHTVNDLERIGDHAVNIAEIAARKIENKDSFSDQASEELRQLRREIFEMFDSMLLALEKGDTFKARSAMTNEESLNRMQIEFRRSHVQRMSEGVCNAQVGIIFIDLVDNVEKIGDHLANIVQAIIGGLQWEGVQPRVRPDV